MATVRKNKDYNPYNCGVTQCLNKMGGEWKSLIIHLIRKDYNRFSTLKKIIPEISKQMLVNQLRELEEDKVIARMIYAEIPPRVEYKITRYGRSLIPVIDVMQGWGLKDMKRRGRSEAGSEGQSCVMESAST